MVILNKNQIINMHMLRPASICIVLVLLAVSPLVSGAALSVRLNINNTLNTVYIPGEGEKDSSELGAETVYTNPPHYYLASYLNNIMTGLAAASGISLAVGSTPTNHSIAIEQDTANSRIFLIFTTGDWRVIDNRIDLIEAGNFLAEISPSFAFGLGSLYPIKLILYYTDILIQGDMILQRGQHRLVVENEGLSGGKPVVTIKKI